jgi:hypothetical protein
MISDEEENRLFKKIDGKWEPDLSCQRPLSIGGTTEADFGRETDQFTIETLPLPRN